MKSTCKKTIVFLPSLALLILGVSSSANAGSCKSPALRGDCYGYGTVINSQTSSDNYSTYCSITFSKNGGSGSCRALSSNSNIDGEVNQLLASYLKVDKNCAVPGTLTWIRGGVTEIHGHINSRRTSFEAAFKNSTRGVGSLSFINC
jgi:hypothetical protein